MRDSAARSRRCPPKYLYDALGSALFEAITELPEYGLTRAEERLLGRHAGEIVRRLPRGIAVAEIGAGSGRKAIPVLDAIVERQRAVSYTRDRPLGGSARELCGLAGSRPGVRFQAIEASYLEGLARVDAARPLGTPLLLMFLGSSIGNFDARERREFLNGVRASLREGDALLLGVDLRKPVEQILAAYDDPLGVTAAFDLNLLARINRELGGDFDLQSFRHEARWSEAWQRVEMHLCSLSKQVVTVRAAGCRVAIDAGETIWTESSYKFTADDLPALASSVGFNEVHRWTDELWPFTDSLWVLERCH